MKLGIETGSLVNHLGSTSTTKPVTGAGATIFHWTDRSAAFVNHVSRDKKTVMIERAKAIRTDSNGMSECQGYRFERTGRHQVIKFLYGSWWIVNHEDGKWKRQGKINIAFGYMDSYYDFTF